MSPEMLTLVAVVLAYDMAREMCEVRSSTVETDASPRDGRAPAADSRSWMSRTRPEKDMARGCVWVGERLRFEGARSCARG
jgi:hypothetical protein